MKIPWLKNEENIDMCKKRLFNLEIDSDRFKNTIPQSKIERDRIESKISKLNEKINILENDIKEPRCEKIYVLGKVKDEIGESIKEIENSGILSVRKNLSIIFFCCTITALFSSLITSMFLQL